MLLMKPRISQTAGSGDFLRRLYTPGEHLEEPAPAWKGTLNDPTLMRRKRKENCTGLLPISTIMETDKHMQVSVLRFVIAAMQDYI